MKIVVMGAGVVGVTTAFLLAQSGHDVTVIDKNATIAAEGSHANGGQLSYDFAAPMGNPRLLRKIPHILTGGDVAFRIKPLMSAQFIAWSMRFLRNCLPAQARVNEQQLTKLAQNSGGVLREILNSADLEFSYRKAGKLVIYESAAEFERARDSINKSRGDGTRFKAVDASEVFEIEPALRHRNGAIVGGIHARLDDVGDAALFSHALASLCEDKHGVQFCLGEQIKEFSIRNGRVSAVLTQEKSVYDADTFVCCLGASGADILRSEGIATNIYPVKGYSLTLAPGTNVPDVAITDAERKLVFSRIGDNIRIAGFADFGFTDPEHDQARLHTLAEIAKETMPDIADYSNVKSKWIGLRPSTPSSLPIVGQSKYKNLFLNMGHGMFGWTLAAVTAKAIAGSVGPSTRAKKWENAA